jgi:hypothetical protein
MGGGSSGGHTSGEEGGGSSGGKMGGGSSGGHTSGGDEGGGCGGGCGGGEEGGGHKGGTEEKGHGLKSHHKGHAAGVHGDGDSKTGQYMGPRRFAGGTGTALHALVPEGLGRYGGGAPSDRGRLRYWGGWTFPEDPPVVTPDDPPVVPPDEPPVVPPVVPPPVVTPDDPPVVPPPVVTPEDPPAVPPPVVTPEDPPAVPPPVATTDPPDTADSPHGTDSTHTTDSSHTTDSTHTTAPSASAEVGRYGENAPGPDQGRYGFRGGKTADLAAVAEVDPSGAGAGPSINVRGALPSEERCDGVGGEMTSAQRYSERNLRRISAAYAQLDPAAGYTLSGNGPHMLANLQAELQRPAPDLDVAGVFVGLAAKGPVTPEKVKSVCAHLCVSLPDSHATEIAQTAELQRTASR